MSREGAIVDGRYRVLNLIGRGGMGKVHRALDTRTSDVVAIKFLRPEIFSFKSAQRFKREAQFTKSIGHENICQVLGFGSCLDGTPYYVMTYLKGISLASRLRRRSLSESSVFEITLQILSGLAAAHDSNVVHRDMKPSNIFLLPRHKHKNYFVKILDFGVSKMMNTDCSRLTETGTIVGTKRYMSPEQAKNSKTVDQRSDVYTVGLLIFESFTGTYPFKDTLLDKSIAEFDTPLPFKSLRTLNPNVSPSVEKVVLRALARDPEYRFSNAADMLTTFKQAMAGVSLSDSMKDLTRRTTDLRIPRPLFVNGVIRNAK